jgi:hypothetical protein
MAAATDAIWRPWRRPTRSGGSWHDRASSARVPSDAWRRRSSSRRVAAGFQALGAFCRSSASCAWR